MADLFVTGYFSMLFEALIATYFTGIDSQHFCWPLI
jgi:hypothetical protein